LERTSKSRQDATTRDRTYLRLEHQAPGPAFAITSVWFERRGKKKQVCTSYKLLGDGIYRTPRSLSIWLDDKDDVFIAKELENWKAKVNQETDFASAHFPDFFLRQRTDFLKWCAKSAKPITIEGYLFFLGRFVFPFFVQRMREPSPERWKGSYQEWDEHISRSLASQSARNRARTALRRYLKYLKAKGHVEAPILPSNETSRKPQREGDVLPGELPDWGHVRDWLVSLPPGKARWIVTICAAFGVRISEAMAAQPEHLIGEAHLEEIQRTNDLIRKAHETGPAVAFLSVIEARKRRIRDVSIVRAIGDVDDDPKTGPYLACCTSSELAELIVQLIMNGEHEGPASYDLAYRFIKEQTDLDPSYPFSLYSPHDFRRLHITLQTFEFQSFFIVAQLHGHSSEETTKKYYQWGLARRQKKTGLAFTPIRRKSND
jgi:integrase